VAPPAVKVEVGAILDRVPSNTCSPVASALMVTLSPMLTDAMLTAPQRNVLELTEMWGYSTKEVAAMQGTSERNVRKLRQRAMDNIRDIYAETLGNKRYLSLRQKQFLERISAD